jgi:hypothetical protein
MGKTPKFIPKLNADLELKQLGTIMGNTIYIDMSKVMLDEDKFHDFLIAQKMLADFFNPHIQPPVESED